MLCIRFATNSTQDQILTNEVICNIVNENSK